MAKLVPFSRMPIKSFVLAPSLLGYCLVTVWLLSSRCPLCMCCVVDVTRCCWILPRAAVANFAARHIGSYHLPRSGATARRSKDRGCSSILKQKRWRPAQARHSEKRMECVCPSRQTSISSRADLCTCQARRDWRAPRVSRRPRPSNASKRMLGLPHNLCATAMNA
jgi:hypothetical protein